MDGAFSCVWLWYTERGWRLSICTCISTYNNSRISRYVGFKSKKYGACVFLQLEFANLKDTSPPSAFFKLLQECFSHQWLDHLQTISHKGDAKAAEAHWSERQRCRQITIVVFVMNFQGFYGRERKVDRLWTVHVILFSACWTCYWAKYVYEDWFVDLFLCM